MVSMTAVKRRAPARESDLSLEFFAQGEKNAAEDVAAYQRQMTETAQRRRRTWLVVVALVIAVAAGVLTVGYLGSS
jgi:hypothetical protein